jgi:pectinesterase
MLVAKDGSGDFKTIQEALNSISAESSERVIINIKNGSYKEKIFINRPNITLIGENKLHTILTYDDYAHKLFPNGEKMGTFNSFSTFIGGDGFSAENITFENSSGSGTIYGQALAVYVDADKAKFKNCRFLGCQDTIFTGPLPSKPKKGDFFGSLRDGEPRRASRQYYENCYIKGDVDFIFGSATAVFKDCEIFSRNRDMDVNGYITAASTAEGERFGYVFINCSLISDAAPNSVYLGRPWRDYAKTAIINCYMGEHIIAEGWHNWGRPEAEKTISYEEYNSLGPGARLKERAAFGAVLTKQEIERYDIEEILGSDFDYRFSEETAAPSN